MTSRDFVIWLKGFTEACNDFTATPKQWDRIKEVLNEVEDFDDNPGLDEEVDNLYLGGVPFFRDSRTTATYVMPSGSISCNNITFTSSSGQTYFTKVWNDQMGNWHYTNYPEGFGYYHNKQEKKQQLND